MDQTHLDQFTPEETLVFSIEAFDRYMAEHAREMRTERDKRKQACLASIVRAMTTSLAEERERTAQATSESEEEVEVEEDVADESTGEVVKKRVKKRR